MLGKTAEIIGKYIKDHMDDNRPMTVEMVKKYALLGRDKQDGEKLKAAQTQWTENMRKAYEQQRAEEITKRYLDEFGKVKDLHKKLEEKTDTISGKADEIKVELSAKQREVMDKILDKIEKNSQELFEKQISVIKNGDLEIAEKFKNSFSQVNNKLPSIVDGLKNEVAGFEKRLAEQKVKDEANIPKPPETQQIMVEETGQIITLQR